MFENWRFNPFTGVTHSKLIEDEEHTIAYHADWIGYGIQLHEAPVLENPSSVVVVEAGTGGRTFTEVPRTQAPSVGEFRVDYDSTGYYGTGRIEFNAADIDVVVEVTYKGNGYVVKNQYYTEQSLTVPVNFRVTEDSQFDGDVVFSAIPTLPANNPTTDNQVVRKKYLESLFELIRLSAYQGFIPIAATEANGWYSVTYGNGVFVAVATTGTNRVMRSTNDGASWSPVAAAEATQWLSVAYGNGVFVAVAYQGVKQVMRSTNDGASWSPISAAEANEWYGIAYGNGVFVAVAKDGTNRVMRSTDDGVTWSPIAAAEANEWRSVAYGNGVFVAVAATGTNRVMRSTDDGVTWSPIAATEANTWYSVTYGNGIFVAVAADGTNRVMRSTDDGVTWSPVAAAEANEWRSVAYGNGVFVAIAANGTNRVMRSDYFPEYTL